MWYCVADFFLPPVFLVWPWPPRVVKREGVTFHRHCSTNSVPEWNTATFGVNKLWVGQSVYQGVDKDGVSTKYVRFGVPHCVSSRVTQTRNWRIQIDPVPVRMVPRAPAALPSRPPCLQFCASVPWPLPPPPPSLPRAPRRFSKPSASTRPMGGCSHSSLAGMTETDRMGT